MAKAIHYGSKRKGRPFVGLNCASIHETLLESELYGHEKGAFTDAREMKKGHFELARGGTLFLDEIGDMSLQAQAKLLRKKALHRANFSQVKAASLLGISRYSLIRRMRKYDIG